jgi:flagellar biosynthesis activator protein FlaF
VYKNPLQAYQEADKSAMTGREIEAYALTKAAMALRECQDNWALPERDLKLEQALKLNQRVWSIFQAELTRADNQMPLPIKQNILKLSAYIDKRIINIISAPEPKKLDIIITINENLAAGLRQKVNEEKELHSSHASNNSIKIPSPTISTSP